MKRLKVLLIILASIIFIVLVGFFLIGYFKPKDGGLLVETNPSSLVVVNGTQVGKTPYEASFKPGEISLKLMPESSSVVYPAFETKLTITSGIKTIVRREFAETEDASSGEIISFEKASKNESSLSVVSIPDAAQIAIDGMPRGFAPYKTSAVIAGDHQLAVSAPGYKERLLLVRTVQGYKLTAFVKLTSGGPLPSPTPTPTSTPSTNLVKIEILSTPNGFLRVRQTPVSGPEVFRVTPGRTFTLLEEDKASGWYKIEYETGKEGWVSDDYCKKLGEPSTSPTPIASASAKPKN